jgi:hypothetical protein
VRALLPRLLLQVVQERSDHGGVEVGQVQLAWLLAHLVLHEAQQKPPGVPVGGDGVRAGVALAGQPFGEKRLEGWCERAHACIPRRWSRRPAARAGSSGTADKYQ